MPMDCVSVAALRPVYTSEFCRGNLNDAIFVALELQLQNHTCKLGAICRRDIARGFEYV